MGIVHRMLQQPVKANGRVVLRLAFDSVRRDMLRKSTAICDPKAGLSASEASRTTLGLCDETEGLVVGGFLEYFNFVC